MIKIAKLNQEQQGTTFYTFYQAYIDELCQYIRQYGNLFIQPEAWWLNDSESSVLVALDKNQIAGFVITGWGSRVDADTESEILEFYVGPPFRRQGLGRQLAQVGFAQLHGHAGFQVYFDNKRAARFWDQILAEHGVPYTTYPAIESNIPVMKYRFLSQAQNQPGYIPRATSFDA